MGGGWNAITFEARYNTLAKQRHPDAGGSTEEMSELNVALEDAERELAGEAEAAE